MEHKLPRLLEFPAGQSPFPTNAPRTVPPVRWDRLLKTASSGPIDSLFGLSRGSSAAGLHIQPQRHSGCARLGPRTIDECIGPMDNRSWYYSNPPTAAGVLPSAIEAVARCGRLDLLRCLP